MDWITLRAAIKASIVSASGLPESDVYFAGTAQATAWHGQETAAWGFTPTVTLPAGVTVEIKIRQVKSEGEDEQRATFTAGSPDSRYKALVGSRKITLQLKIVSQQQVSSLDCFGVESLIRTRLKRSSIVDALQTAGLGVGGYGPAMHADYDDHGRKMSACIVEVPMWAAENDIDDTEGSADWIESVRGTGETGSDIEAVDTERVDADGTITPV